MKSQNIIDSYTNIKNPGSFSGLSGFLKNNKKIKKSDALSALNKLETFTLHNPVRKKIKWSKHISGGIDHIWHLDLADVRNLRNKSLKQYYSYLLVCVDVLSKFAWVEPMINKEAETCTQAFKKILERSNPRKPKSVYMDKGREFMGSFSKYCKKQNIEQYFTNSIHKASIAERFNRTIKEKLYRYFTYSNEKSCNIKILQDVLSNYNNSYHRSIKTAPANVTAKNENDIFNKMYAFDETKIDKNLKIGDYVRIPVPKQLFDKGYTQKWSKDIFIINSVKLKSISVRYTIKTLEGDVINKLFYREQLQNLNFEEFPYDTYQYLKENDNQLLVKQLNTENAKEIWISKSEIDKNSSVSSDNINDKDNNEQLSLKKKSKWSNLPRREGLRTKSRSNVSEKS